MSKISSFGGLFFVVLFLTNVAPVEAVQIQSAATSSVATSTASTTAVSVEKRVREYFADIPVMIEIAKCESKFRQFTDSGAVLRSNGMIGIFQFYESIHTNGAKALGFDLATVEGNLGYARHVYTQEGTAPWKSCVLKVAPQPSTSNVQQLQLRIKLLTELVGLLQQLMELKQQTK